MKKLLSFLFLFCAAFSFAAGDSLEIWSHSYRTASSDTERLAYLNKITYHIRFTNCRQCIEYCDTAETIAMRLNDWQSLVGIYINKSISFRELAKNKQALDYSIKAVHLAEKINDSLKIGAAYLNMGALQHSNNVTLAEKYYLKALELFRALKDRRNEYKTLGNLSDIYNRTGRTDLAYASLQKSLLARKQEGKKNEIGVGYYLIAFNLSNNNLLPKALLNVDTAIVYLQESSGGFYYCQSLILKAEILNKLKQYKASNELLLPLPNNPIVADNIDLLLAVYNNLSKNCEKLGDPENALKYARLENQYSDSLYEITNLNTVNEVQEKFETEKKEQEIELLNKEKKLDETEISKQKLIRNTFIIGSLVFLAFIGICIRIILLLRASQKQIALQKEELELKRKETMDSFYYAQRIQQALLAGADLLQKNLPEHLVLFKPKDIVSGDFYWASPLKNGNFAMITADSTGHGVPGAFMSLLNISFLNESVNERNLLQPNEILNHIRSLLIRSLAADGSTEGGKDGMDCTLCVFDFDKLLVYYAAANNPLYICRNGELIVCDADKMPVGKSPKENTSFTAYQFQLRPGDILYTFTDGYADQFGGPKGKKFKYGPLKSLLLANSHLPLEQQAKLLNDTFEKWKGTIEQTDDVLIIAIKV